jgi:ubiquitin-protein ligase
MRYAFLIAINLCMMVSFEILAKQSVATTLSPPIKTTSIQLCKSNSSHISLNQTVAVKKSEKRRIKQSTNASKERKDELKMPLTNQQAITGQRTSTLRRIKSEWRDAIRLGIAYDWVNMKDISKKKDGNYSYVRIGPYGSNLLNWHFSIMGVPNSSFDGGIYHGRVLLPRDYPGSPPRVQLLTPSGRFIPGHDICLSASNYHPESWTPKWTILSLVEALRIHMLTQANEIGGMTASLEERRQLAKASRSWIAGKLSHSTMIQQGAFPWNAPSETLQSSPELSRAASMIDDDELDFEVQLAAVPREHDADLTEYLNDDETLAELVTRAALEILRRPSRVTLLLFLTLFLILNFR